MKYILVVFLLLGSLAATGADTLKVAGVIITGVSCNGGSDGKVQVNIVGGTPPYTYQLGTPIITFGPTPDTTHTFTNLPKGTYWVFVTDDSTQAALVNNNTVSEPDPISITYEDADPITCHDYDDGIITVMASGESGSYNFTLDPGAIETNSTGVFENLSEGTYTVEVTDATGCSTSATSNPLDIVNPPAIDATVDGVLSSLTVDCNGDSDGSIYIDVSGGAGGYSYNWTTGDGSGLTPSDEDQSGLTAGTYNVNITDANTCSVDFNGIATITEPGPIDATVEGSGTRLVLDCNGDSDGSINISVTGGNGGYTFNWSTSDGSGLTPADEDQSGLTEGTYSVSITDSKGCSRSFPGIATVTEPDPLDVSLDGDSKLATDCHGDDDGTILIDVSGGNGGYTFNWTTSDGSGLTPADEDQSGLSPGTYSVTVFDARGCTRAFSDLATITEPEDISVSVNTTSKLTLDCHGDNDGSIILDVSGGNGGYSYDWTTPDGSGIEAGQEDQLSLTEGTYNVEVTDSKGCNKTVSPVATITQPADISVTVEGSSRLELDCYGDDDGRFNIAVSGGTAPYSFLWSGPGGYSNTSEDIASLETGIYDLRVTDDNGCKKTYIPLDTITQPPQLDISLSKTDISCNGSSDGTITAGATGGTPPCEYSKDLISWDPSGSFSGLSPGKYNIYARDANLCEIYDTITLTQPEAISISSILKENAGNTCYGDSAGTITITAGGGTKPLEYSIDSGATYQDSAFFDGLPAGNYYIFVRDANGCIKEDGSTIKITQPPRIIIDSYLQLNVTTCYGDAGGQISITGSGGTGSLSYSLDGGSKNTTGIFNNIPGGGHVITIEDENNCTRDTSVNISQPPPLTFTSVNASDVNTCYGDLTGSIEVTASGGTGSIEYSLDGGAFQPTGSFGSLAAGDYLVTAEDDNGCSLDTALSLDQPDTIYAASLTVNPVNCYGDTDGSIMATGSGGTPPYTYTLDPGSVSNATGSFTNLPPGSSYSLTIEDANGCPPCVTGNLSIDEPPPVSLDSVTAVPVACHDSADGALMIHGSGGTAPYSYSIDDGASWSASPAFDSLPPGTYHTMLTDSSGCSIHGDTITLDNPLPISPGTPAVSDITTCFGDSTGSVAVSATGGTGSVEYSLNGGSWNPSGVFTGLPAGDYDIVASDSMSCTYRYSTVTISQPEPITATFDTVHSLNGEPGEIHVSASGGTGALEYSITGSSGPFTPDTAYTGLIPAGYDIAIRDANGCLFETMVEVKAIPPLEVAVSYTGPDCHGQSTGSIELIHINGNGVVRYSIDDSSTYQTGGTFTGLPAGKYIIFVMDEDYRNYKDTVILTQPPRIRTSIDLTAASCNKMSHDGEIDLEVTGGIPPYSYLWSNDSTSQDLYELESGIYTVAITDSIGCEVNRTVVIPALASVNAWAGPDTAICPGNKVILDGSGGSTFIWQPATGLSNAGIPNPVVSIDTTTTYVLAVAEPSGCFDMDTVTITVHPLYMLYTAPDTTVAEGSRITLRTGGDTFTSYRWLPENGLDDPSSANPELTATGDAVYHVYATTPEGCVARDSIAVTIAEKVVVYSGFTPNGDGVNDYWDIDYAMYYPGMVVEVYNRWGERVFSSKGYSDGKRWDGTYKNKALPTGTYYYVIDLGTGFRKLTGPVTIVR